MSPPPIVTAAFMEGWGVLSLWRLALIATWFDPLIMALGALKELASSEASASVQRVMARREASCGLPAVQDRILTLSLTVRGVVPASDSVTVDDAVGRRMIALLMRNLARGVL